LEDTLELWLVVKEALLLLLAHTEADALLLPLLLPVA
jgi:hypothetical protein